ncbi:AraC family transcriptional regulator [Cocleimonas flava]|uniref:AraC-like DNA-binding protein n=1 Tax=Cocleimonas flava TaxID=634765 RepID=A0A4R1F0V5_9GAMM|nr:AraC family transcriptional regulator [Cocleimonas flava]TCJ87433.1 AraC-like DNA-binding protein [Cocleimonas flava]
MKKNKDIPLHSFKNTVDNVQSSQGKTLEPLDPEFPFVMTSFGAMNESAQAKYPHRHDCYEVLYICEGEGTHIIDFEPYPVKTNTFYFLSKDQVHFWQLSKPLKGYALLFTEEFLGIPSSNIIRTHDFSFFHDVGQAPYLSIDNKASAMVNGLFDGIEQEFRNETVRSLSVLRAYLHILLTQLHRLYDVDHPERHAKTTSPIVRHFSQLVSEHFISEHSVKDYANKIGISTSHLTDTIKAVTGQSPGNIIRQKLAVEAKRLLVQSNASIAEIGYHLNFEDSSYFGRFFKRETGMSPAAFRQEIREKYQIDSDKTP